MSALKRAISTRDSERLVYSGRITIGKEIFPVGTIWRNPPSFNNCIKNQSQALVLVNRFNDQGSSRIKKIRMIENMKIANTNNEIETTISLDLIYKIRWLALFAQFATILFVTIVLQLSLPLMPLLIVIGLNALLNQVQILYATNQPSLLKWLIPLGLSGDAIALSAILFLTGGISNPFSIFLLAPSLVSAAVLGKVETIIITVVTILGVVSLFFSPYLLPLPNERLEIPVIYKLGIGLGLSISTLFFSFYIFVIAETSRDKAYELRIAEGIKDEHENLKGSIRYASTIQKSMLIDPAKFQLDDFVLEIFWQPKDTVGGDAYFVTQKDEATYIVAYDCTGHGVPGAFLTLLVNDILQNIFSTQAFENPAQVLQQTHEKFREKLRVDSDTTSTKQYEGLDAVVLRITKKMIHYASANIAGFSYKSNVDALQKDRQGLGFKSRFDQLDILSHSIRSEDIDGLIFFSDGVIDQVNPSTGRVLGKKRFQELLGNSLRDRHLDLTSVTNSLRDWQSEAEQRDDQMIIHLKRIQT